MLAGALYDAGDDEIQSDLAATRDWLVKYNALLSMASDVRRALLAERFGASGAGSTIRPPSTATTDPTSALARACSSTSAAQDLKPQATISL